jgi:uncharacterized protein
LGDGIVTAARSVEPIYVGTLDAIHIASALSLDREPAGVATYDHRMTDALARAHVKVIAPE